MESYPMPKPAPPRVSPSSTSGLELGSEASASIENPAPTADDSKSELPPLWLRHPEDEERVKKVTDPKFAELLVSKGWILLDKKPVFKPKDHLTESLRDNPALQQMRRDLLREAPQPTQRYSKRPQTKRFTTRRPNSK